MLPSPDLNITIQNWVYSRRRVVHVVKRLSTRPSLLCFDYNLRHIIFACSKLSIVTEFKTTSLRSVQLS